MLLLLRVLLMSIIGGVDGLGGGDEDLIILSVSKLFLFIPPLRLGEEDALLPSSVNLKFLGDGVDDGRR
jgi:hypothetical protein